MESTANLGVIILVDFFIVKKVQTILKEIAIQRLFWGESRLYSRCLYWLNDVTSLSKVEAAVGDLSISVDDL